MSNEQTTISIKAILIEPKAKTVRAIDLEPDLDALRTHLLCDTVQAVDLGEGVTAWIDDEGVLKDWDEQGFTDFAGVLTLAGNVVLTGTNPDDNSMANFPDEVGIELVRSAVRFIPPQEAEFPGTSIVTIGEDGKPRTEFIGPEVLTYENH